MTNREKLNILNAKIAEALAKEPELDDFAKVECPQEAVAAYFVAMEVYRDDLGSKLDCLYSAKNFVEQQLNLEIALSMAI